MSKKWMTSIGMVMWLATSASAENVDLSTIPPRDTVQLTIYNGEDLTLVRETRHITFKKGLNPLQFSWANTLIDPTSVELRFKDRAGGLELIDTAFPHDKPQMLYWNVRSERDVDAEVEITYFTSGITWAADYVCVSDPAEEVMSFEGFVRITNNSGEDYADAQIRLVVGTINLVEKVAELARRGAISKDEEDEYRKGLKTVRTFKKKFARAELRDRVAGRLAMATAAAPKEIIKEGLSEYFIYTIEGQETIRNTWSKRMRSFQGKRVPFRIQYRYRPAEYGDQLVRLFLLRNDDASDLGTTPLPNGALRLFRDNGREGLSFLVQQQIEYVPVGQEIVMNLGHDPEVIHERIRLKSWRDDFWYAREGFTVYYSPQKGHRIRTNDKVAGWDDHQQWIERIRNNREKPIDVEIRRTFAGHVAFRSDLAPVLHDYRTPQFTTTVEPGGKQELAYHLVTHQGYNKKQDNVTLEEENG
ncbi:MAG: hypothetical protein MI923_26170 [Phycisphaerales bacterium]|nr:hypothetical protein [Phycisphaerales bacterium]